MAGYKYNKQTISKFAVKGVFDAEAKTITYETKEDGDITLYLQDILDKFASQPVDLSIKTVSDEELSLTE